MASYLEYPSNLGEIKFSRKILNKSRAQNKNHGLTKNLPWRYSVSIKYRDSNNQEYPHLTICTVQAFKLPDFDVVEATDEEMTNATFGIEDVFYNDENITKKWHIQNEVIIFYQKEPQMGISNNGGLPDDV